MSVFCVGAILLPSLNYGRPGTPLASDAFDGQRYVIGQRGVVQQGNTGASVLATLAHRWGYSVAPASSPVEPFPNEFVSLARDYGFRGHWVGTERSALESLPTPFIVRIRDERVSYLLVNEVRNDYVYATDPNVGNVLYPLKHFLKGWQKQAFVLEARQ